MKTSSIKLAVMTVLAAATCTVADAQEIDLSVLERLEIDPYTPVAQLTAGQLVGILQFTPMAPPPPTCADFSTHALGTAYTSGANITINGIQFTINYSGGAIISSWPGYPNDKFLEMLSSGNLEISSPFQASRATLDVIQAANTPITAALYNNGNFISTLQTSHKDVINSLHTPGTTLDKITVSGVEALIYEVCFYQ